MDKRYQKLLQAKADLEQSKNTQSEEYDRLLAQAGDELTDDERTRLDSIEAEVKKIDTQLDVVISDIAREETARDLRRQRSSNPGVTITDVQDRADDDPMAGFADGAEFALAVRAASLPGGGVDDRLRRLAAPTNYHQETGSSDGYMVPVQMAQSIWEIAFSDEDEVLNAVDFEDTSGNIVSLLADETTPWGATGITASWGAEGGQLSASRLDTDERQMRLHKLHAYVLATEELRDDAPRLEQRLTRGAGRAIRWEAAEAIVRGTGAGQPLGFLNSPALVTVSKESGPQAADTIVAENVLKMYSRQLDIPGSIWLANVDTYPELATMTIGDQPAYQPAGNLASAPYGMLQGRPIFFTEHADTLGDVSDLMFVSLRNYYAVRKQGAPRFAQSMHLFFDYDIEAYRWTFRMNGQPFLSAPVTPNLSSNTKSHFVVLEAR